MKARAGKLLIGVAILVLPQFAGQIAKYKQVSFEQTKQGAETKISGTIPSTLADFKIDPPSLLTVAVKNEIPIRVEMTWQRQK
jgi:hypothetical protein